MSQTTKITLKKWLRVLWYGGFFFAACFCAQKAHGWQYALWFVGAGLFYNEASKAFRDL